MRKIFVFVLFNICFFYAGFSQSKNVTLSIGEVDIRGLNPGDEIIIPVSLVGKTDALIGGFTLFINFDHNIMSWKGTLDEPENGVRNVHPKLPLANGWWIFNDNGNQMVALWDDGTFKGINIYDGDLLFEFVFTYKGGLNKGERSNLTWGTIYEVVDGRLVRGITEMYDESVINYSIKTIDGFIQN
jgi:hypothetical protein